MESTAEGPLSGLRIVELSSGVGAAYAGRLLATLGAETVLVEPPSGHVLRREPPFLPGTENVSALFSYLSAGKRSVVCDLATASGREDLERLISTADIFVCGLPLEARDGLGLTEAAVRAGHPSLVYVSVLPFGATGEKAGWAGEEVTLIHAAGEGFLLPNGLSAELFPGRPPLKIHGYFAEMQGGIVAAMGAIAALLSGHGSGEGVDVSIQDAALAVGAFAIQRLGDGEVEHRITRSFKYGGVLECADGYLQLLTLEDRQWQGLVELMGSPAWAQEPALADALERGRRGAEINQKIRAWAEGKRTADLVARAQRLGVPMAKYASPAEVLSSRHVQARGLFQSVDIPGFGPCPVLVAPFHLSGAPLAISGGVPQTGADQHLVTPPGVRTRAARHALEAR